MFCGVTLLCTFLAEDRMVYDSKDVTLFFTIYGPYFQNLFIKTSTWLVVTLALYRNAAISFPIAAKQYLTAMNTCIAVLICFVTWILFLLPMLWSWVVDEITCPNGDYFIMLDVGTFEENITMRKALTHTWTAIGFILPVCILAYCNLKMIISLHTSLRRSGTGRRASAQSSQHNHRLAAQRRMTITLITIVASFFLLVFPSELFQYYLDFGAQEQTSDMIANLVITCNTFQSINMSINFVLYCGVNSNFRKTLKKLVPVCCQRKRIDNSYDTIPLDTTATTLCPD